jgi:hypothetical protein
MSISNNRNGSSFVLRTVILISTSTVIAATLVDISFTVEEDVFSSLSSTGSSSSTTTNMTTVDGIRCDTVEFTKFHIHAHLDIFVDGKPFIVPSQIGIDPEGRCLYWLHTHDDSGIIHIESPTEREFTIGNFIEIWKKTLGNTELFGSNINDTNRIVNAYVNGVNVPLSTDFRNIGIKAHDEIALIIGPIQADKIPSEYQFEEGL